MSKKDDELGRKKKLIVVGVLTLVIIVGLAFILNSSSRRRTTGVANKKPIETVTNSVTLAQQSWIARAQSQLQKQAEQIRRLEQAQKEMMEKTKELEKEKSVGNGNKTPSEPAAGTGSNISGTGNRNRQNRVRISYPPPVNAPLQSYRISSSGERSGTGVEAEENKPENSFIGIATPMGRVQVQQTPEPGKQIKTNPQKNAVYQKTNTPPSFLSNSSFRSRSAYTSAPANSGNKRQIVIPPGSFVRAYLLTGADVPTMGNGSVGPIPVIFRVMSLAQLPNFWKANIKSCFLIGQATGSLSAERAYIRITKLSCIKNNGQPLVRSVRAYVTGSDGKVGLAGRVVSKQGAILARALISGFLKGVGQAFSQSQMTISISPFGQTQSVMPNTRTLVRYGLGGGISSAVGELARFYMKMANQMFPVIEINAGRHADVIFLNEVSLGEEVRK